MLKEIISNFIDFDKKWCFFAITNVCNNRCETCSIWKEKPKIVRFEDAKKVLDKLYENNFRVLQLTGGEPLMNPDFFEIVKYAKKLNFFVFAPTNGTLINEDVANKLKESKIDQISISLHHYKPKVFEKISSRKNILEKVTNSIEILKDKKFPVSVLCTISKDNINDIESIVKFIDKFGITVSFCMPVTIKETSFRLGNNGNSINLNSDEMKNALLRIIKLKKQGYNIINSLEYLRDTIRYLDKENRYDCFGGTKLFYIDWNLNVYPCMCKGKPVNIDKYNFNNSNYKECNKCMIQCFREPSTLLSNQIEASKIFIKEFPFLLLMCMERVKTLLK